MYVFCQILKDNGWIDVWWGPSFAIPQIAILYRHHNEYHIPISPRQLLVCCCVSLWAGRLAVYLGTRHLGGEDYRYQAMRKRWNDKCGKIGYYIMAYLYIFMMQYGFSILANWAGLYVQIYGNEMDRELTNLDYAGAIVWAFGLSFETVGDMQLQKHIADKNPKKGKFIKWGLWRITRHPNYFGECVCWWGVYMIACGEVGGWKRFFAPLFITLLIRFLSGVPLLEMKFKKKYPEEFKQYCKETTCFIPFVQFLPDGVGLIG